MDIYAFPLSPADILRVESIDEKIDRLANEALQEIRQMADAARREFAPVKGQMHYPTAEQAVINVMNAMRNGHRLPNTGTLSQLGLTQRQGLLNSFRGF